MAEAGSSSSLLSVQRNPEPFPGARSVTSSPRALKEGAVLWNVSPRNLPSSVLSAQTKAVNRTIKMSFFTSRGMSMLRKRKKSRSREGAFAWATRQGELAPRSP